MLHYRQEDLDRLLKFKRRMKRRPTQSERRFYKCLLRPAGPFVKRDVKQQKIFIKGKSGTGYIVDFFLPDLKLVFEIDGPSHENQREYDAERTSWLSHKGIYVDRVRNELTLDREWCLEHISGIARWRKKDLLDRKKLASGVRSGEIRWSDGRVSKEQYEQFFKDGGVIHRIPVKRGKRRCERERKKGTG